MSRMRITGSKRSEYDDLDARTHRAGRRTNAVQARRRCHAAEINACHAVRLPSKPCAQGGAIMNPSGLTLKKKLR
jgi:hypothetical protein